MGQSDSDATPRHRSPVMASILLLMSLKSLRHHTRPGPGLERLNHSSRGALLHPLASQNESETGLKQAENG